MYPPPACGLRPAGSELGESEGANESDGAADYPDGENEGGRMNALSNDGRVEEYPSADDPADDHHRRIEHTETADVLTARRRGHP